MAVRIVSDGGRRFEKLALSSWHATAAIEVDASVQAASSVESARATVRRSSRFTYLLSLLLPAGDRPFFWAWYAYLRWVDDIADNATIPADTRYDFLTRQIRLVEDIYSGKQVNLSRDESPVGALAAYDIQRGGLLKDSLIEMLGAMQFDIRRQGTLSGHEELHRNFDHEVANYLFAMGYFCRIPDIPARVPGRAAANGAKIAHILRDLLQDWDEGIFNISREEIDAYGLALPTLKADIAGPAGRRWIAANVRLAERQLMDGLLEASQVAGIRYRIIVAILVAKYQAYLDRFRATQYDLQPQTGLGYAFARSLLSNLGVILMRRCRRSDGNGIPERLVACALPARALLLLRLLPVFNRSVVAALGETLRGANVPADDLPKLRRRFVTAYWIGRTSFASIDTSGDERRADRLHHAGLVYAYWSLAVLELDTLIDDRSLPPDVAEAMVDEWLGKAVAALAPSSSAAPPARLQRAGAALVDAQDSAFRRLTDAFQASLSQYRSLVIDARSFVTAADDFMVEARAFLMAQINSRDQRTLDPRHDWNWYLTRVINQKTLGFALAPMALWVRDGECRKRRNQLEGAFLALNKGYWHWQILDDLADVGVDTRQGRVTTPGFVLLSQGALARSHLDSANAAQVGGSARALLTDAVLNSGLVCERFVNSPLMDGFRHLIGRSRQADTARSSLDGMMRCALVNSEDDVSIDLTRISVTRRDQAACYLAAMQSRDWDRALDALAQSGVANRLLSSIDEDIAGIEAREQVASIAGRAPRTMLAIIELLIRHCYRKAIRGNVRP